ncbi:MAG: hypothetical protein KH366_07775 [Clostridiaceae bacterium]|nr:hypothetical protein [Clostridiaceae bacterium]
MGRKTGQKKKIFTDNVKAGLLRWWIAGMCYFFIGFGTQAGLFRDPIDLIFFLGVGIGLVTIVVYNPIAYGMFDIVKKGRITNKSYYERKGWQNALLKLAEIFKNMFTVGIVYLTYQGFNMLLNQILGLPVDTILIPGEPFGFATLYLIYYQVLSGLADTVREARQKGGQ